MADTATEHMSVAAPPQRCYDVAADLERYPEWAADIKEIEIKERDEQGRPLLVTFRAAAFGRSTSYTLAYDYSEAPHVLSWKLTQGDITTKLDGSYVFDPGEGEVEPTSPTTSRSSCGCPSRVSSRCGPRAGSWPRPCAS